MIQVHLADTETDLIGIKKLQLANLSSQLSTAEKESEGFVTCEYSVDDLKVMNSPYPHVVATWEDEVVGYCLVMLKEHCDIMPVLKPMFDLISELDVDEVALSELSHFTMGQVCIAKSHRGAGVFYKMYDHLRAKMSGQFDLVITEISANNTRSLQAHEKQGFKVLKEYVAPDGLPWVMVYWDWR